MPNELRHTQNVPVTMTFEMRDENGDLIPQQDFLNWTDIQLQTYIEPAAEFARTVTFTDTQGGTFSQGLQVVVGEQEEITFNDAHDIVRAVNPTPTVYIHDGESIPMTEPTDPDSDTWKQFNIEYLGDDDEFSATPTVLIDGTVVAVDEVVNGMTFKAIEHDTRKRIKVRVSGGVEGQLYTVTVRFSTNNVPSDDRSQCFYVRSL